MHTYKELLVFIGKDSFSMRFGGFVFFLGLS